jgi:hypothetical protein
MFSANMRLELFVTLPLIVRFISSSVSPTSGPEDLNCCWGGGVDAGHKWRIL